MTDLPCTLLRDGSSLSFGVGVGVASRDTARKAVGAAGRSSGKRAAAHASRRRTDCVSALRFPRAQGQRAADGDLLRSLLRDLALTFLRQTRGRGRVVSAHLVPGPVLPALPCPALLCLLACLPACLPSRLRPSKSEVTPSQSLRGVVHVQQVRQRGVAFRSQPPLARAQDQPRQAYCSW